MNQPDRRIIITHDCGATMRVPESAIHSNCQCPTCKRWFVPSSLLPPTSTRPLPGSTYFICPNPNCGWRGYAVPKRRIGYFGTVLLFLFLLFMAFWVFATGSSLYSLMFIIIVIVAFIAEVGRTIYRNSAPRCICPQCHGRLQ